MNLFNNTSFEIGWQTGKVRFPKPTLTVIVKGTYRLRQGDTVELLGEQPLLTGTEFADENDVLGLVTYPTDFALFKPKTDILLVGTARSSEPVRRLKVALHVGGWSKALLVYGDRTWTENSITDPQPFDSMDLSYDRAFGGPDYKLNPKGRGCATSELPNLEDPERPIRARDDRPGPSGFGPIPYLWPQRASKAGTYDEEWIKTRWPSAPKDYEWSHENEAPEDQQVAYLRGDETIRLEHVHPSSSNYETRLPALRIRAFHGQFVGPNLKVQEVMMNLDTLWIAPESDTLVLVWRGVADLRSEEPEESESLLVVSEPLAKEPRSPATYATALELELEGESSEPPSERLLPSSPLPSLPAFPSRESIFQRLANGEGLRGLALAGADLSSIDFAGRDLRGVNLSGCTLSNARLAGADLTGADLDSAHLEGADLAGATLCDTDLTEAVLRGAKLQNVKAERVVFTKCDLSGADLRGADLRSADLRGARLHDVVLTGANLTDASIERAWGCRVRAEGANLTRIRAAGANLGESDLRGVRANDSVWEEAQLYRSNLSEADLSESDFEGVYLSGAQLSRANLRLSNLRKAGLAGVTALHTNFFDADLQDTVLANADLRGAHLFKANLEEADLEGARLDEANLNRSWRPR